MKIEVLYVPGCPNYQPAVARIREVLASESLQADVHGIPVSTDDEAKALLFPGLSCRLYANRTGLPSEEVLRLAMREHWLNKGGV